MRHRIGMLALNFAIAVFAVMVSVGPAFADIAGAAAVAGAGAAAMGAAATAAAKALPGLLKELKEIQEKYAGKPMPEDVGKRFEELATEAKAMQDSVDRDDQITSFERFDRKLREVPDPTLPAGRDNGGAKNRVAGYVTLGDFVLASEEMERFRQQRFVKGQSAAVMIDGASLLGTGTLFGPHGEPLVPLTRDGRKAFESAMESKAVPTIGTGVLEPERLTRVPQVTPDDRLTFSDVINTGRTGAGSVSYVREEAFSDTAAETAHGAQKPEQTLEYTEQTATVATIAGWIPVHNQQLEDWPQLRSLIDGRLRYSVQRRRDYQLVWGNGTAPNLQGIMDVSGTQDIEANGRYDSGDHTLIDVARMGITDVLVAGYQPNFLAIHPYDWEAIVLEKGTDNRYVWAVVTDENGSRIWGLRVVESVAMQERAGVATERRVMIVGDGQMGAQILDRAALTVLVGAINDQFIRNMRTILAEERLAFPIYAPAAFAFFETQASAT
jgi:HK97 family phage major capsid protein